MRNRFMDAIGNALRDLKQHPYKMVLLGMTPAQGRNMANSNTKAFSGGPHAACGGLYREASLAACTAADSSRRAVDHYGFYC
jgi:hypothetical protein